MSDARQTMWHSSPIPSFWPFDIWKRNSRPLMKAIGHRKNDAQAEATQTQAHTDAVSPYFSTSSPVEFLPDDRLIHSANKWLGSSSSLPSI
jgi:hypothetical protein